MKNRKNIVSLFIMTLLLLAMYVVPGHAAEEPAQEYTPCYSTTMNMYKGETTYLSMANVGGASSVSFKSSDTKVVTVSSKGLLTAKSCGKATITITMKTETQKLKAQVAVKVVYSRTLKNTWYTKSWKTSGANTKLPVFTMHKELKKSSSTTMKITDLPEQAVVTYASSKPSIATVSETGKVVGKTVGDATITATIDIDDMRYLYKLTVHVKKSTTKKISISKSRVNSYFSTAGFIGSSIGVGQKNYFNYKGKGFLGNPVMMVKGCYSFNNDNSNNNTYKITYNGVPYKARVAVKKSGVKKVFINMGTNDMCGDATVVRDKYVDYLKGIRKDNPKVVIFIESTTPVYAGRGNLNNKNIDKLNKLMKEYCAKHKNMYFVDISSALKTSKGALKAEYCSDHYCHITYKGYEVWMNTLVSYVKSLLIAEQKATDAVKTYEESHLEEDYDTAVTYVNKLSSSTVRTDLKNRLKAVK